MNHSAIRIVKKGNVQLRSVSGEGVSLSEPNPTCVTPNTPPDE